MHEPFPLSQSNRAHRLPSATSSLRLRDTSVTYEIPYARSPNLDVVSTALAALTGGLVLLDPVIIMFASNMHNGLRGFVGSGAVEPRDIIATLLVTGTPTMGILAGLWYICRCRKKSWRAVVCAASVVLFHTAALYSAIRMEECCYAIIL